MNTDKNTDMTNTPDSSEVQSEDVFEQAQADLKNEADAGQKETPDTGVGQTQASGLDEMNDAWEAALQEQAAATEPQAQPDNKAQKLDAAHELFKPLAAESAEGINDLNLIKDIPIQLSVELGRTRITIKDLMQLGQGSVLELDAIAGEPMDIFVNGFLIAQGEVVVVDEKYGIRVTDILTPSERLARLNGRR